MHNVEEFHLLEAVLWLRRLVVDLLPRRSGFDPRSPHVRYVVDQVALGQVLFRALLFFPIAIIPPLLRTHPDVHVTLTRTKTGETWNYPKQCSFGNRKCPKQWSFGNRNCPKTVLFRKLELSKTVLFRKSELSKKVLFRKSELPKKSALSEIGTIQSSALSEIGTTQNSGLLEIGSTQNSGLSEIGTIQNSALSEIGEHWIEK